MLSENIIVGDLGGGVDVLSVDAPKSDKGGFGIFEVELEAEPILADDLLVDKGVYEVGVGVPGDLLEREAHYSANLFKVSNIITGIGHQDILVE